MTECNVTMLKCDNNVDRGAVRPSARTLHSGGWNSAHNGFVVFGGEFDSDMCEPETYILRPGGPKGWIWSAVSVCGDQTMPAPGKRSHQHPKAPWGERGRDTADTGR